MQQTQARPQTIVRFTKNTFMPTAHQPATNFDDRALRRRGHRFIQRTSVRGRSRSRTHLKITGNLAARKTQTHANACRRERPRSSVQSSDRESCSPMPCCVNFESLAVCAAKVDRSASKARLRGIGPSRITRSILNAARLATLSWSAKKYGRFPRNPTKSSIRWPSLSMMFRTEANDAISSSWPIPSCRSTC
jgi:hypothetical protein